METNGNKLAGEAVQVKVTGQCKGLRWTPSCRLTKATIAKSDEYVEEKIK